MFRAKKIVLASIAGLGLSLGAMGCQTERPDVVPSSAQMWDSGNQMMHYQAPADGMVYVFDHAAQRLIWSGKIMKGQSVDVDTQKATVMAGGMVVVNKISAPANQKDIYFDPAPVQDQRQDQRTWNNNSGSNTSNGVTVTPNVTVQPNAGNSTNNGVTVQPGVTVSPSPAPAPNPQ